jgi:hypothetical protein
MIVEKPKLRESTATNVYRERADDNPSEKA